MKSNCSYATSTRACSFRIPQLLNDEWMKIACFACPDSFLSSVSAFLLRSKIQDMHNTALQQEITQVSQVDFTASLRTAKEFWAKKQETP